MSEDVLAGMAAASRARVDAARALCDDARLARLVAAMTKPPPRLQLSKQRFDIIADKPRYQVGDPARLLLKTTVRDATGLVTVERDGEWAIKTFEKKGFDAVLLDLLLPALNGYEVARRLRQEPVMAGALLIAMTGYGQERDRRMSSEAGFDHHLVKPVDPAVLQGLLASAGTR